MNALCRPQSRGPGPGPTRSTCRPAEALIRWLVRGRGLTNAKVFRLRTLLLPPGGSERLRKRLSLAQMSTRTHHPGRHQVDLLLNGRPHALGHFDLHPAPAG